MVVYTATFDEKQEGGLAMDLSEKIINISAVVCVVGVGYVGLPLAEAFSKHLKVIGYDISEKKWRN